jgi:nicotinamide-nucleotide amidase
MKAFVLAIGNELTSGQSIDTNSAWLSERIGELGIFTVGHMTVPDEQPAIAAAIRHAAGLADLLLISGGLGPTPDDLTRQAVAEAMGVELQLDEACLAEIEEFFAHRRPGGKMAPSNRIQAMLPVGATAMPNARGTAPGIAAELGKTQLFVMPGVPCEMTAMFENCVLPRLPARRNVILHRVVNLFGAGESDIVSQIGDIMHRAGPVIVGTTVAGGMVSIRVTSRAQTSDQADAQAQEIIRKIRDRLGEKVVSVGIGAEATMAASVGTLLQKANQTLATAESCTGGLLGKLLTDVPGASEYYLGGMVTYDNQAKQEQLGVPAEMLEAHGAVSEQVAGAMALGVRQRFSSDWGIGITGIAGPDGGSDEKPLGLVYTALADHDGAKVQKHLLHGDREIIRLRAALVGLNALRLRLLAETGDIIIPPSN